MFLTVFSQNIKVFLAEVTSDASEARENLKEVLIKAGIEVVEPQENLSDEELEKTILETDCAVYILGTLNFYSPEGSCYDSQAGRHYRIARKIRKEGFKMFFWNPAGIINMRNNYINSIRRDIVENTIYSATTSPIVFVEDLRTIMNVKPKASSDLSKADIYFIYNDLDKDSAEEILSLLTDIQSVKKLCINMSSRTDYSEKIAKELPQCKIGVIYVDYAKEWALSFARQVWKDNGGQGGKVPLFVAGNQEHISYEDLKVLKGVMECSVNDKSLIPLDLKIFYDNKTNEK
ncbi:MAG: hypothetical protein IKR41_05225 [Bacteroidales bacterium]|nr:hypothetical protein [Bacteroidales bacterium]